MMVGYKGFGPDLTCRDLKYELGKITTFSTEPIEICEAGLHFCQELEYVFVFYDFHKSGNMYAKVEVPEGSETISEGTKTVTNALKVVELLNGTFEFEEFTICLKDGKVHRDSDLPAVEYKNGTKMWYKNGLRHRDEDKPAVVRCDGTKEYFIDGIMNRIDGKPTIERPDGTKLWLKGDCFHRDGGLPAIEEADGRKEWWVSGLLHRDDDLPAVVRPNGTKEWYTNGRFIRANYRIYNFSF